MPEKKLDRFLKSLFKSQSQNKPPRKSKYEHYNTFHTRYQVYLERRKLMGISVKISSLTTLQHE